MVKTFTAIHYVCQMNGNSYQRGKKVAINVTRHFYNLFKKKKKKKGPVKALLRFR